jgi:hypothetical protein
MAEARSDANMEDQGAVLQAIQTFEGILEVFPEDVSALESLTVAYEQAGDAAKARECAMRLAELSEQQADWHKVHEVASHILEQSPEDKDAAALQKKAEEILAEGGESLQVADVAAASADVSLAMDLSGELELAWFLLQNEMINQDQYEAAISGLTEARMNPTSGASLSLLQELASMDRVYMDKIIGFLSAQTTTPYIDVSRFEIEDDVAALIPMPDAKRLGILPFDRIRKEVMVVTLNPVDESLRQTVSAYLDTRVHFFITKPHEFQAAVDRLAKQRPQEKAAEEAPAE